MEIGYRHIVLLVGISSVSFAAGRMSVPEIVKTETKKTTETTDVKDTDKEKEKDKHYKKETKTTKHKDGTTTTTTTITLDTSTKSNDSTHTETDNKTSLDETKTVKKIYTNLSLGLMMGKQIHTTNDKIYGAYINKAILGPITIGVFGFTDRTAGVSLGLVF